MIETSLKIAIHQIALKVLWSKCFYLMNLNDSIKILMKCLINTFRILEIKNYKNGFRYKEH